MSITKLDDSTAKTLHQQAKQATDAFAKGYFDDRISQASVIDPSYARLWQNTKDTYFAGGKRLRPYLTFVGYGTFDPAIVNVAFSQEILHVAMLMHDDIIDRDNTRHGRPNMNGLYAQLYEPHTKPDAALHYAHSAALMAGDCLISEAYVALTQGNLPGPIVAKLSRQMHRSLFEIIGGELLDVEAGFIKNYIYDPLTIYRYKTAGYSFIGPLLSGAICADASPDTMRTLEEYGTNAGIAFQIQDDLLGVFGDETATGKSTLSDLEEKKHTILVQLHQSMMTTAMANHFAVAFSDDATKNDLTQLKQDLVASGAKQAAIALADEYYDAALRALTLLKATDQAEELRQFTQRLRARQA